MQTTTVIQEAASHYSDFQAGIRAAVRGLWLGALTRSQFIDSMTTTLENGLNYAWRDGAEACDVPPEDWTTAEVKQMSNYIDNQVSFVPSFADDIKADSKAKGGTIDQFLSRADIWANRYNELRDIARLIYCEDERLEWRVDKSKENCRTCLPLDGWVKRASYWRDWSDETGIYPQSENLICGGYHCGCGRYPTRKPISKGRPPVIL